jgi:hypothetical protein
MSKRKVPADFMDRFLSGKENTESTPSEHPENTERTREGAAFETFKKTELVTFSIRVRADDLATLREHFERIDVPMSQGIRQIVLDYMSAKGLR